MPGNPTKQELKGAIVQKYDILFFPSAKEGPLPPLSTDESFWSSFFSITPKLSVLEWKFLKGSTSSDVHQPSFESNCEILFNRCVETLSLWYELDERSRHIKVLHALNTLAAFFRTILKKASEGDEKLFQLFRRLLNVEDQIRSILSHICSFLSLDESPDILKDVCLNLLLIFTSGGSEVVTGSPINTFLVSGIEEKLFKVLVHLLSDDETSESHRSSSVLLLTILVQYRKYESDNPYAVQLSLLDEEVALSAYSRIINSSLSEFLKTVEDKIAANSEGWLNYFVGSMFVSENKGLGGLRDVLSSRSHALLALYEAIHLNRNFIATLTHYSNGSSNNASPSNLLVTFLEFCSFVMADVKKGEWSYDILKLNFIILLCVTEDHYANVLMHDSNLVFRVKLQTNFSSSRYNSNIPIPEPKPLAHSILDLAVKFIGANVKKLNTLVDLCSQILSVVHRLLSYEKKSKTRLRYPWQDLWKVLMDLLESISKESNNPPQDYYALALKAITIFNLFITFGDTFLPSPSTYDELYYEMTRRSDLFSKLYQKACTYSAKGGKYKESAVRVTNGLVNIRAITSHFKHIIEAWLKAEELSTPTPEQTLEVVKSNYESLTLKLQEGLDQIDPYSEAPTHIEFFEALVRSLIKDTWSNKIILKELQPRQVLETFSHFSAKE